MWNSGLLEARDYFSAYSVMIGTVSGSRGVDIDGSSPLQREQIEQGRPPDAGEELETIGISLMPFIVTVIFGLIMSAGLFYYFVILDNEKVTERLQRGTDALIQTVTSPFPGSDTYFATIFGVMDSLRADLPPGTEVDQAYLDAHFWETPPQGFETVTLEYLPRVSANERNELAPRFGNSLPADFNIHIKVDGRNVPAPASSDYFPVLFEASNEFGTDSIGVDRGANLLIHTVLNQARDTGEFVTYGFYPRVGMGDQTMVIRFFYAIYATGTVPDTVEERREQLMGFVSLSSYTDTTMIADLIPESYQGVEGAFFPLGNYQSQPKDPAILAGLNDGSILETVYQLPAEGFSDWMALTRATPEMMESLATPTRWWVLSLGLLFTFWAGSMMLWSRNYSLRVTNLVRKRTRELADRTESLSEANQSLQASESRYRMLADNVTDVIFTCDMDGVCTYISPSISQHSGIEVAAYTGHKISEHLTQESVQQLDNFLDRLKKGSAGTSGPVAENIVIGSGLRCSDDTVKPMESMVSVLYGDDGAPTGILCVSRDISERKKAEQEKLKLEEAYRQSQKMEAIGTLAGGVAHDFNNLLAVILGHGELLKMRLDGDEDTGNSLDVIEKAALRAKELTGQLLGFARKGRYQQVAVNLNTIVSDLSAMMGRTLDKKIEVTADLCDRSPMVTGDPGQLNQLFLNLAVNARDAMPEGGKLHFETRIVTLDAGFCSRLMGDITPGEYCEVVIKDTGIGMSREKIGRIFEPFYTDKGKGSGTGMGLAMVYGVARNHGGAVTVESVPGQGSTFHVYISYSAVPEKTDETIESTETPARGSGRILVVDDEEMVRHMTRDMLDALGYEVVLAGDGEEAVEIYREKGVGIDLAIVDMVMPKLGGIECLHALREIDPGIKVILATGYSQDSMAEKISNESIQGFLQKPFNLNQLSEMVTRALK